MNKKRLEDILAQISATQLVVYGDYFLDNYLTLDRSLSETSLETGLEAYQVIETRKYPGVAGVVVANLRALGANVFALGLTGDDGNGYEMRKRLLGSGVDVRGLLEIPGYETPTYNKPIMREADGREHELNRMDVKPRAPLAAGLEDLLISQMKPLLTEADGLLVVDQSRGHNCGVVTDRTREELHRLAELDTNKIIMADSREYLKHFTSVILKANLSEALRAVDEKILPEESQAACAERCGRILCARTKRPVVITLGGDGIFLLQSSTQSGMLIPAIPVTGPIDIVGAGDSVNASVGAALCAGATLEEACFLGNLVASVDIQQIGVTGTASPQQVMEQYLHYFES
jgi:rfaE bifunctional protein kinase chain/domain